MAIGSEIFSREEGVKAVLEMLNSSRTERRIRELSDRKLRIALSRPKLPDRVIADLIGGSGDISAKLSAIAVVYSRWSMAYADAMAQRLAEDEATERVFAGLAGEHGDHGEV
jgi:hypothetical protein